jgi:tRNA(Ile)-lysidine synthase
MTVLRAGLGVCNRRLDPAARRPLAVAYSGGGDSLALLLVAKAWADACGRPLLALHVDHGLQPASRDWAGQAAQTAATLGVPFRRLQWSGLKPATGLPAAARAARHALLADAARDAGASVILLGHTLDDQLENAVMRGAGAPLGPLAEWGPSPVWPGGRGLLLCRPLLAVRRAELRDWLNAQGRRWIDDPANDDLRYARARARQSRDAVEPLPPAADIEALAAACRPVQWGGFEIDRKTLADAPPRLLQLLVACSAGTTGLSRPGRAQALLARDGPFTATLAGARIQAGEQTVLIGREAGEAARGGLRPIQLPAGVAAVWDGRFEIMAPGPGWTVRALDGLAARLSPRDALRLRSVPAGMRASLPVISFRDEPSRVHLALGGPGDHLAYVGGFSEPLAVDRFAHAAGLVREEREIGTNARMANSQPPPYVEAVGKD